MRRAWRMRIGVGALAVLTMGSGFPTVNREISDKAQCRMSYGRSVRVLSVSVSLRVVLCHRERLRGNVPPSVDCSDPWSWESAGYAEGAYGLTHDLYRYDLESENCTATVDTPDQVGYLSCPAPCDAIAIANFSDVGDCFVCLDQPNAVTAWQTMLGTPPVTGDKKAEACQSAIGRAIVRYAHKRMKLQAGCEFKREVSKDGYENFDCVDIGAPTHPLGNRISRFRARMVDMLTRRCGTPNVASLLDTCGADGAAIGECVAQGIELWADTVHPPIYPPLPPL